MINIGQEIRKELQAQERQVSWLATKMGCSRSTIYSIFDKTSVDTQTLLQLSRVLRRNFFALYIDELSQDVNSRNNNSL